MAAGKMHRLQTISPVVRALWERALRDQAGEPPIPGLPAPPTGGDPEINVLITGKVGAGKSSLINAFAGKYLAERRDEDDAGAIGLGGCTTTVDKIELHAPGFETKLALYDTPGFADGGNDAETAKRLQEAFANKTIHLVIMVRKHPYNLSGDAEDVTMLKRLKYALGKEIFEKLILVFSRASHLPAEDLGGTTLAEVNATTADWMFNHIDTIGEGNFQRRFVRIENSRYCPVNSLGEKILPDTGRPWWPELIEAIFGVLSPENAARVSWLMARDPMVVGKPRPTGAVDNAVPPSERILKFIRVCVQKTRRIAGFLGTHQQQQVEAAEHQLTIIDAKRNAKIALLATGLVSRLRELNAHSREGFWRVPAHAVELQDFMKAIDIQSPDFPASSLKAIETVEDPFVGGDALKRMLHDICPSEEWCRTLLNIDITKQQQQAQTNVRNKINELPEELRLLWKELFAFCQLIKSTPASRMSANNLGIVLGPMLTKALPVVESLQKTSSAASMVTYIIDNQANFF